MTQPQSYFVSQLFRMAAMFLLVAVLAAPFMAQQPSTPARQPATPPVEVTFDNLLAADRYKLYGEVRNVGQLLSNGGAGEIVDPIIKLAEPPKEFKSIISFLKKNSEALASSRLMFATWPARTDVPNFFVAIEFPTNEDAAKFAPKLETFLPTVLPPVPVTPEATPKNESTPSGLPKQATQPPANKPTGAPSPSVTPSPPEERLPFEISHAANLVFISDRAFKLEKLHPRSSKALFQDQNFRTAHDKFSSEPIFFFINVALEDKTIPQPSPTPVLTEAEKQEMQRLQEEEMRKQQEEFEASMEAENKRREQELLAKGQQPVLAQASPMPTPTPTKEQEAQRIASSQIGGLLDSLGYGETQMPEAVGLALVLEGDEYIVRALLIDKPEAKRLPIPFIPQLVSGPPYSTAAASVLPEDTDVLVSASIDLTQTYEGMRKAAETRAKNQPQIQAVYRNGGAVLSDIPADLPPDPFAEFEKKGGFKIKDDLLPVLGNEIALTGSLKTLQSFGGLNLGVPAPTKKPPADSAANTDDAKKQPESTFPILLIEIKDRDGVRKLMPHVLEGLGIGEANLVAQTERREDTEMVNYAGMFAYAFVGNFLVLSDAIGVRHLIDANVNHQTLSANTVFHNSRRWQSGRTLGEIYISPALMEGYQDEVRKQSATLDPQLRDFLLGLNPNSEAITYALSNDGLGTQHELHLPKNLILTMVAGMSSASKNPPPEVNEMMAMNRLRIIASAEQTYQSTTGNGSFGTLDQLMEQQLISKERLDTFGYAFTIAPAGDRFEAVATPQEYGKTGKRSFFIDQSGVLRGDDHGGGPATIADKPVEQ